MLHDEGLMTTTHPAALIVDDEPSVGNALRRRLARSFETVLAHTGADALRSLEERSYQLIVVDIGLPDMSGLDVLLEALRLQPSSVRAALTGMFAPDLVHRVELMGATFLNKPAPPNLFDVLAARARASGRLPHTVALHVGNRSRTWKLSPTEQDVLLWSVAGGTREEYCERFDVAPSTFDSHVKAIRAKVPGHPRLSAIVQRLLLDVIEGSSRADS